MRKPEQQMNKLIETVYVSSAVNSTPNCLDWGLNGLVVYGSSNAIHLYDPQIKVSKLIFKFVLK